jgi:creatinine amidohydrolase
MRLEMMLGGQIRDAVRRQVPLALPAGTIEYHGEHCACGCDTLVTLKALERLSQDVEIVIAPAIYYGPASYAVAGPEYGSIDVNTDNFSRHVRDVLRGFLEVGFHNIFVVIHHQYEAGVMLPEALAFDFAAKQLIFEYMERTEGKGWWGQDKYESYYDKLDTLDNPFNWIKVIPLMSPQVQKETGYDHAGEFEASLLMALCPEAVDLSKLAPGQPWYTKAARKASRELGEKMVELILQDLREKFTRYRQ